MIEERRTYLLSKQQELINKPEISEAIKEQERLFGYLNVKKELFDSLYYQSLDLIREGTKMFLEKYPKYKELIPNDAPKIDIIDNVIRIAQDDKDFNDIIEDMKRIEKFKEYSDMEPLIGKAFYEYSNAFIDYENRLKKDWENLFTKEYKTKMALYADQGVLLYFMEIPSLPLLDERVTMDDILDSINSQEIEVLVSYLFKIPQMGISLARKLDDVKITIELIKNKEYRSAARNLFALLDSEHKKAAKTYEGYIEKEKNYKTGKERAKKIDELIDSIKNDWLNDLWEKVNNYYSKVVATIPYEGVIHRNTIVHGDYEKDLIDVDHHSIIKLMLLWLNLRILADYLCNREEMFDFILEYLPALVRREKNKEKK